VRISHNTHRYEHAQTEYDTHTDMSTHKQNMIHILCSSSSCVEAHSQEGRSGFNFHRPNKLASDSM
jgi:hypothetical protein